MSGQRERMNAAQVARPADTTTLERSTLGVLLRRVRRRLTWIAIVEGAAAGLAVAAIVAAVAWWGSGLVSHAVLTGILLAAAGMATRAAAAPRSSRRIAALVERRTPTSRNVIMTVAELADRPVVMRDDIRARLLRDADRVSAQVDPAALFPARRATTALTVGAALWAIALVVVSARAATSEPVAPISAESVSIDGIEVRITAPGYAGGAVRSLTDPARIEALAGSRLVINVNAVAASVRLETISGQRPLDRTASGRFTRELIADADGFIAIEAAASDGTPGPRRLIGLAVMPDLPPRVRVTVPGRDLFLPEARGALDVTIEADDDLGLASLRLRHTRVSGSGERFTFIEGETPLTVTRTDARRWTARGTLPIGAMELGQGDVIVYRGVATDRRPGAVPVESDAFLVEITAPGAVASEGFAADDELDRNAVSQQMVILKTERLLARRPSMTEESFAEEARSLAAEQRRVRAEFVFMMGGELAEEVTGATGISELHEEEEAEAGDDILAGRLANRGRVELVRAIRSMSEADAKLVAVDVAGALADEKEALEHLQNAFSRTRYILRALTQRERLDLSRRLTGLLADAGRDVRPIPESAADPRVAALRTALAGIASLAESTARGANDAAARARASELAQSVLRVDPSSDTLQAIAAQVSDAGNALGDRRLGDAREHLDRAAVELARVIRAMLADAAREPAPLELRRLEGALRDAQRRTPPR